MNLSPDRSNGLLYANFNQDATFLCVGTTRGFSVWSLSPLQKCYDYGEGDDMGGYAIAEMLRQTSLVAIVRHDKPRRLQFTNSTEAKVICTLNYVTPILAVRMNMKRLVLVMETKIHIYDIPSMALRYTIDTSPNPQGLCALSNTDDCLIAYPRSEESGEVVLFDGIQLEVLNIIKAHKTGVTNIAFDPRGELLATSSVRGTLVRVFEVGEGSKFRSREGRVETSEYDGYAFRRGTTAAVISSVCFSPDSQTLCCATTSGYAYLFRVNRSQQARTGISTYFPGMLADMWQPERAFTTFSIPEGRAIVSFAPNNHDLYLITESGEFMQYLTSVPDGVEPTITQRANVTDNIMASSVQPQFL